MTRGALPESAEQENMKALVPLLAGLALVLGSCTGQSPSALVPASATPLPTIAYLAAQDSSPVPAQGQLPATPILAPTVADPTPAPEPTSLSTATSTPEPTATATPAATPSPAPTPTPTAVPTRLPAWPTGLDPSAGSDWPTYHHDLARTGVDGANMTPGPMKLAWTSPDLPADIYAEPLIVNGHVLVATEDNTVRSFDIQTGALAWETNLGEPVPLSQLPCGNIDPNGITGTPFADGAANRLYVVAFLLPGTHTFFALDLSSGTIIFQRPVDPPGAQPLALQQRAALNVASGKAYVAYGGLAGDCGDYNGWVVSVNIDGTGDMAAYKVPTQRMGGIWSPAGPTIDANGRLYVATGNGSSEKTFDYGSSVIRLSPDLQAEDYFAPSDWAELNAADLDVGSTSPTLLENGLVFQIGKSGKGYLIQTASMGQLGGEFFAAPVCDTGSYGGTAYAPPYIFIPCLDGVAAVKMAGESFTVAWRGPKLQAGPPIVAAGAVWAADLGNGILVAMDKETGIALEQLAVGAMNHFATPSAGEGHIVMASQRTVAVFEPVNP